MLFVSLPPPPPDASKKNPSKCHAKELEMNSSAPHSSIGVWGVEHSSRITHNDSRQ